MGLSFRKSIKIGKNTRINLSRYGGIGISTGVKGARVSINNQGVRTTLSAGGLQYRKDISLNKLRENNEAIEKPKLTPEQTQEYLQKHYTKHMQLILSGIVCIAIGTITLSLSLVGLLIILVGAVLDISGLVCAIKNWKRINKEYKIRISK